ncbi:hypothetical protein OROGR_008140 [Orobanche gracilis]
MSDLIQALHSSHPPASATTLANPGRQTLFGGDAVKSARHRINPMPSLVLGREVYTCWPTNSGAEEFNFGSRIDHILSAGPCLHEENHGDSFVTCHVKECDILRQFKRWKPGNTPRHKDIKGRIQLKGSDHVPVYISLIGIPDIQQHNTPSLSTRYCPEVYGRQQTVGQMSMFTRRSPSDSIDEYICSDMELTQWDLHRILKRTVVFSNGLLQSQRTDKFDWPRTMKMWLNIPTTKIYLSYAHLLGFSKRLYEDYLKESYVRCVSFW